MPSLAGFKWVPIVTVLKPTSAMNEGKYPNQTESVVDNSSFKWLRGKRNRRKKAKVTTETSVNNHT